MHLQTRAWQAFDFLRGVAASAVVFHHVLEESQRLFIGAGLPKPLILLGASGVDIFFVISGFIMLYTNEAHFGQDGAATNFLVRRMVRIAPIYWLLTLAMVMLSLTGLFYKSKQISMADFMASLFLLPSYEMIVGVAWTLQYEMYFYLLFALWIVFGSARSLMWGLPVTMLVVIAASSFLPGGQTQQFFANRIAIEFCFGLALAFMFTRGLLAKRFSRLALLIGVAGLCAGTVWAPDEWWVGTGGLAPAVRFIVWGVPSVLIMYWAIFMDVGSSLAAEMMLMLGDASYSLYLTHTVVMTGYAKVIKTAGLAALLPTTLWIIVAISVSIGVGIASYWFVERRLNRRLTAMWRSHAARDGLAKGAQA